MASRRKAVGEGQGAQSTEHRAQGTEHGAQGTGAGHGGQRRTVTIAAIRDRDGHDDEQGPMARAGRAAGPRTEREAWGSGESLNR